MGMEKIILDAIEKAADSQNNEQMEFIRDILDAFAQTANCPSNWRSLKEQIAETYEGNKWVTEQLELWNI